ncbi:MAG: DUF402 domain-containing protein [Chloroflexi bacterium]|nr:DUF402 domain-containing protein [Chloroflexota bacterium]
MRRAVKRQGVGPLVTSIAVWNPTTEPLMQARINYARIGKPSTLYTEGFVADDGNKLKTFSVAPPEISLQWSARRQQDGLIPQGRLIGSVEKHHFYNEYFTILKICDSAGHLLGYYCDIASPLQKIGDEYFLTDRILDVWVYPNLTIRELDWSEFAEAVKGNLLTPEIHDQAVSTLERLKAEISDNTFPSAYLL